MDKIIMLGDSLIDWNYNSPYINYGKNGYRTRDVFYLLEENREIIGDIAILLVGVNDFFTNMTIQKTQDYYSKIVIEIKKRFKKVVLISLLPTDRKYINERVDILNLWIKSNYPTDILDIHRYFLDDELKIMREYTTDGIHLNRRGYEVFNRYLDEKIMDIIAGSGDGK